MPHKTKEARRAYGRLWRSRHPERARAAQLDRTRRDGWRRAGIVLSDAEYDGWMLSQDGRCAICRRVPDPTRRLSVDHDHKTGRVRGLLCHRCNMGLGYLYEDLDLIRRAMEYLETTRVA